MRKYSVVDLDKLNLNNKGKPKRKPSGVIKGYGQKVIQRNSGSSGSFASTSKPSFSMKIKKRTSEVPNLSLGRDNWKPKHQRLTAVEQFRNHSKLAVSKEMDKWIAMTQTIDRIWAEFDEDNSGSLDYWESKQFITKILTEYRKGRSFKITNEVFKEIFAQLDMDGSGTIEKVEMLTFVQKMMAQPDSYCSNVNH